MSKIKGAERTEQLPFTIMTLASKGTSFALEFENQVFFHTLTTANNLLTFLTKINGVAGHTLIVTEMELLENPFPRIKLRCK